MKLNKSLFLIPTAIGLMGMAMPSCPGQQAMQQQIDALQTANTELTKKVQTLTLEVNTINTDMAQVKQILPQITNLMTTQKTTLDQYDIAIKDLQAKWTAKSAPKKKK
jgi:septal ring factor EnvC (AmiA/AmiB activator)